MRAPATYLKARENRYQGHRLVREIHRSDPAEFRITMPNPAIRCSTSANLYVPIYRWE